jgi:DNA-binding transcriptional ArsR family regulator
MKTIKRKKLGSINKIIHEPARLFIMSHLARVSRVNAIELKASTGLTWGNLSIQLRKLEISNYINITKQYKGRKPETIIKILPKGRKAYRDYKIAIKNIL